MAKQRPLGPDKAPKIGLFDSGIGGLSILASLLKKRPDLSAYYIADDAFAPYGTRSEEYVVQRSLILAKELWALDCDLIVVACNTATAVAVEKMRSEFKKPIVGVEPYINYVNKGGQEVKGAIGVLTTPLAGKSQRFIDLKKRLDPQGLVGAYTSLGLATLVEKAFSLGHMNTDLIQEIEEELRPLKSKALEVLILGCTHYPLIQKEIEDYLNVRCVSAGEAVAQRVDDLLNQASLSLFDINTKADSFYFKRTSEDTWIKKEIDKTPLWPKSL